MFVKKLKKLIVPVLTGLLFCGAAGKVVLAAGETVKAAQPETNIVGDVSIVREVNSKEELTEIMAYGRLPSTVILNLDKNLKVLGSDGTGFASLDEAIAALEYKVLQVFYVTDKETVDNLAAALNNQNYYDAGIMSGEPLGCTAC